jgi:hypothetical protein
MGHVGSGLLIPFLARLGVPVLVASLLCIAAVGLPVTLWFIRSGDLELHIAPLALFLYGINILFVSTILQVVLILFGVRQIFGLHIDTWFWSWPSWMTNGE